MAMSNLVPCPLYRKAGRDGGEMNCGKAETESEKKNIQRFFFFNEHSVQKAGTQDSASDIIHLAKEDPVMGRGRQRRSVTKTTSL